MRGLSTFRLVALSRNMRLTGSSQAIGFEAKTFVEVMQDSRGLRPPMRQRFHRSGPQQEFASPSCKRRIVRRVSERL